MMQDMCREKLMTVINETSFAMYDCVLFLDTHPTCQEALQFYQKCKILNEEAREEYTAKYGPLTSDDVNDTNTWTWNCGPWPWQLEG